MYSVLNNPYQQKLLARLAMMSNRDPVRPAHRNICLLRKRILNQLRRLELNGTTRWFESEPGGLFAGFTFEADERFDDEFGLGGLQTPSEFVPLRFGEDAAYSITGTLSLSTAEVLAIEQSAVEVPVRAGPASRSQSAAMAPVTSRTG